MKLLQNGKAMRLRVMGQMAKGLVNEQNMTSAHTEDAAEELDTVDVGKELERVRGCLKSPDRS
jgi:hypothetical protein